MQCKYCGVELPSGTHGKREYCNDAHRQAFFKKEQKAKASYELKQLQAKIVAQEALIEEQTATIARLRDLLDVERRYLADINNRRGFKSFLKKQPRTPFIEKILAEQLVLPYDTRRHYEYNLRVLLHATDEEKEEFTRLWKLMLLTP